MTNILKFHKKNYTIIPEGYQYCHNCEALTPHKESSYNGSHCEVCNSYKTGMLECPNCRADESEDYVRDEIIIKHHKGCHSKSDRLYSYAENIIINFTRDYLKSAPDRGSFCLPDDNEWFYKNKKLHEKLKLHKKQFTCGCPRFKIYKDIHQIVVDGNTYASMDCSNASWWRYKTRCKECGFVYISDADSC